MKEMSYRDKMVILIISIIIILVAGFFALIRPTYNKMVTDTAKYESTKTEWDGIKQKLDAIPALKEGITKMYQDAKKDAVVLENKAFGDVDKDYDVKKVNHGLDQFLQQAIDDNSIEVTTFTISGAVATDIAYYYYTPNVVTYALLESGDVNGKYAEDITNLLETSQILQEREVATVMGNDVNMSVTGTKENLMTFLDAIKENENAVNVSSVTVSNYQFEDGATRQVTDAEGNVQTVADPNAEGKSTMTLTIRFFNAKEIDNPDLGD
jgi:hypothetical protein